MYVRGESGNLKGKPKGAKSEKVKFWNQLKEWMVEEGSEKFKSELMKLQGKEFVTAYSQTLEYFKPKLSRAEVKNENNSTLTIKREVITKNESES